MKGKIIEWTPGMVGLVGTIGMNTICVIRKSFNINYLYWLDNTCFSLPEKENYQSIDEAKKQAQELLDEFVNEIGEGK